MIAAGGASAPKDGSKATSGGRDAGSVRPLAVTVAGAILSAGAIAGLVALTTPPAQSTGSALAVVEAGELTPAIGSLDARAGKQAAEDARACRVPLAKITITGAPGASGTIRVRSGSYVSPPITLADAPQHVAVPFPAPYASGKGVLAVEGKINAASIYLTPGWRLPSLDGTAQINVWWTPKKAC